jgi:SAM-dependent methyltransferase
VPRYETAIDLGEPNNSHTQLITLVGLDKTVLDVGCATGDVARALAARGCRVSGVDADPEAETAREVFDELVIADLDRSGLTDHFKAESFDAVVFGDVLEHLHDPGAALRDARTLLRPGGRIVVSVPNVAHGSLRLALLGGRWDYTDQGLLDRTHLRFYTLETVCELLEGSGLVIEVLRSVVVDPLGAPDVALDEDVLPPTVVEWVRDQPGALDYQYVVAARALAPDEVREPRPALEPIVAYDVARRRDRHHARMLEDLEDRHRRLTRRDHVIGLEATVVAEQQRTSMVRAHAEHLQRRVRRLLSDQDALTDELEQLAASRRPRPRLSAIVQELRAKQARRTEPGTDGQ